ncbi:ABC transporter ATP-binding protein [Botrimarina hoheduenensis]|uniref:Daunorubicin/doxorubicin resistance ATP-binding protein DrrA n=1 Tax=Botrimarina hoheduenensis TaxID=2528000 RepID=A0A5C5VYP0_9BACT|nr:ABC transporter ATP-binding protein [Botrimarina hoheduenensis]TWT42869.1 Daunorubicin/doxorubicin resistance ATP-binding protein DrrA [Botrimarina hoheduenensis]
MNTTAAIRINEIRHHYGQREALGGVSLEVREGEILGLLGPNGSGKTTLFKLLATLMPIQAGSITVGEADAARQPAAVRAQLGVVFQSPSLDKKLRVEENLRHHGRLYGLSGGTLRTRIDQELERFGVADRRRDIVETLSGGLQRRAELAQAMLHRPRVLVLDEPSAGLDPAARSDLWRRLAAARAEGLTVIVTTHLLEEAERADRLAILDGGRVVADDTPAALRNSIGGDTLTLRTDEPEALAQAVRERLQREVSVIDRLVRLESDNAAADAAQLLAAFPDRISELTIGRPSLEDVFFSRTGKLFHD